MALHIWKMNIKPNIIYKLKDSIHLELFNNDEFFLNY